jgi:hypothetical protein
MARFPHIPKPRNAMAKRQLELRQSLWPEVTDDWLWSRHTHDGFTSLPKGMPLILSIMDDLSKGQPVSSTYLELWCRTFDESFVTLSKPRDMAFYAGFDGQRAERTWRARLDILSKLHFIELKEGSSGPASYALIYDPYKIIKWHVENKTPGIRQDKYNALLERAAEIKEHSLSPPAAAPKPAAAPPSNWPGGVDPNAAKVST